MFTDVFRGACCLLTLMLGPANTSETSVNLCQKTWRNNPSRSQIFELLCDESFYCAGNATFWTR
jgi:hypothetical protein